MKEQPIKKLVEDLYERMLAHWERYRRPYLKEGFSKQHEQGLYDAVCEFRNKEKTWLT